jgi:hypothetical protein
MKRLLALLFFSAAVHAQSIPNGGLSPGQIWTIQQWLNARQAKVDVNGGALTAPAIINPAINGGTQSTPAISNPSVSGTFNTPSIAGGKQISPSITTPAVPGGTFNSPAITGSPTTNGVSIPIFPQTAAEIAVGVCNSGCILTYPAGNILRYGSNIVPGTTDMRGALVNALAVSLAASIPTRIPSGLYFISSSISVTIPALQNLSIFGDGSDSTALTFAAGGLTLNYSLTSGTQTSSAHVRDISFLSNTVNTQNGLTLSLSGTAPNPANAAMSDVSNCVFRGADGYAVADVWEAGIRVISVSNINFNNDMFVGSSSNTVGIGAQLTSSSSAIGVVYNFNGSVFNNLSQGMQYGNFIQGVSVVNSNFTEDTNGIVAPTGATNTDQLLITGSQFNCAANGILLQAGITDMQVSNNYFLVGVNSTAINMISAEGLYSITNNIFQRVSGSTPAGSVGVSVGSASNPGPITNNMFFGLAMGIVLNAASLGANIQGNNLTGCTLPISIAGTNHVIANNPGYNPVGVVGGFTVGASPATITNGPTPTSYYFSQSATFNGQVQLGGRNAGSFTNATTPVVVYLGPNESCTVTWTTTAPTYFKSVH